MPAPYQLHRLATERGNHPDTNPKAGVTRSIEVSQHKAILCPPALIVKKEEERN